MEHFVTLERAIACPHATVSVAAETAAHVLTAAGYRRGLGFGPTSSYVRAYRPWWAVTIAAVLALPTLGLSLFILRFRRRDYCNVVIEDGPYGVVALVSGRVPAGLPAVLEAAGGGQAAPQPPGGMPQQPPPPVLLSPTGGPMGSPSHTPQAILRPATPVPPLGAMGPAASPPQGPSFDPYPVPGNARAGSSGPQPGPSPDAEAADAPAPVPGPVRPPSRLAPPLPPDLAREQVAARGANGSAPPASPPASSGASDDDPISSTSGRVPWVGGGRPGPLPAPPAPAASAASAGSASAPEPAPAAVAGRAATAVSDQTAVLRADDGVILEIGPFCLLGREPVPKDGDPAAKLVRFDDAKLSVSKTHLAYGVDAQGLWVTDRNSTNGTTLIDPDGRRAPCAPGKREYLTPGWQVQIGQRKITVEAPAPAAGA